MCRATLLPCIIPAWERGELREDIMAQLAILDMSGREGGRVIGSSIFM